MDNPMPQGDPRGVPFLFRPRFVTHSGSFDSIPMDVSAFPVVSALPGKGTLTIRLEQCEDLKGWGPPKPARSRARNRRSRRPRRRRPAR